MSNIKLLDGKLYDKNALLKKMDNDEFYYGELNKLALSSSSLKTLLSSPKTYKFVQQYLQTFATVGFFGLIILIYLLSHLFIVSIIKQDYIVAAFLFLIALSFLTESMLERQAGVVFFTFFYLLLVMRFSLNKPA